MHPLLAQADLNALPANWLKYFVIALVAAVVVASFAGAAVVAWLQYARDKRRDEREEVRQAQPPPPTQIEPNPLPITKIWPPATVRELAEKHSEHERRLDKHDQEITDLWNKMRDEDKDIRAEMAQQYQQISLALGRIEGALNVKKH